MNLACAEIIESSIHTCKAHCWQWDKVPQFGSLVTIRSGTTRTIFALVSQIQTGSFDPQRTAFPFQKTEEELKREQPQIFSFLATTFTGIIAGYQEQDTIMYQCAPEPPKIHAFVYEATAQEYEDFFTCKQYMHMLFSALHQTAHLDELLLAIFKQLSNKKLLTQQQLHECIETFSLLTGNDYRRLKLFLQRAGSCVTIVP